MYDESRACLLGFIIGTLAMLVIGGSIGMFSPPGSPSNTLKENTIYIKEELKPPDIMLLRKEGSKEVRFYSIKIEGQVPEKFVVLKKKGGYKLIPCLYNK
jgi:hypothetical protein